MNARVTCEEHGESQQDAHNRPHEAVLVAEGLLQVVRHRDRRLVLPLQLDLQRNPKDMVDTMHRGKGKALLCRGEVMRCALYDEELS